MSDEYVILGFKVYDCNVDLGWEYSKVAKYDEENEPYSIAGPDGAILVFYEEWEIYGEKDMQYDYDYNQTSSDYIVYLLPKGQTPQDYTDLITYVIDTKAMENGVITGQLYYNEFECTFVGDHSADFSEFYGFYP
jgi:hypothetical protein